jgi:hypothetical protein
MYDEFSNLNSDSIQNKLSFNGVFYEKKLDINILMNFTRRKAQGMHLFFIRMEKF